MTKQNVTLESIKNIIKIAKPDLQELMGITEIRG